MEDNYSNLPWRTAALFISSTFIDMHEERDVLNSYVLPKLNDYFSSKRIMVQLVDLRWGVRTSELEEESARDNKVLSVCLDEIDRCQPFFIAILGDRYGYDKLDGNIVDTISNRFNAAAVNDNRGFHDKSVTELEILYGALLRPDKQLNKSLFCMRHADYSGMPETNKREFTQGISKMTSLKKRIAESCDQFAHNENIIDYYVSGWDNDKGRFESFDKVGFGELLYAKLVSMISEHFSLSDAPSVSFPELLINEQESFLDNTDDAIGLEKTMQHVLEQPSQLILVLGESGIGKTTFLKYLARHLSSDGYARNVLYYNAGLSSRCRNVKNMLICWIWQVEQMLNERVGDYEELSEEELRVYFENILQKGIEKGHEFWMVIDSYDSFYKNAVSESLSFLRFSAKSFVSTQLDTNIRFHRDIDTYVEVLKGLALNEAKEMMIDLFGRLHKEWNPVIWDLIKNKFEGKINPLWIELAVNVLSSLSAKDFLKIKVLQSQTNDGSEALEKYLCSLVAEFPPRVDQMFKYFYNKVLYEEDWTLEEQFYLWYISLSRNGIRESDLASLTKQTSTWEPLLFAWMRYRFRSCIIEKGVDNCWGFSHELYNRVVEMQIKRSGERMNDEFLETARGRMNEHLNSFLHPYIKKNDTGLYVDFLEMLHGALGHHYVHCDQHYDLRISECIYHLLRGNDMLSTAVVLLNSYSQEGINEEFASAVREIAEYIIDNNIEEKKHYKVPKGMPIPVIGSLKNPAVICLMDMIKLPPIVENHSCDALILIFATAVTQVLSERGASSASYCLNLRLQSEVAEKKALIPEESRMILSILIEMNVSKAQYQRGESYDVAYQKTEGINGGFEKVGGGSEENESRTSGGEMHYIADFHEKINMARKEMFLGNYDKAISICKELQQNDEYYSRNIPETVYNEGKGKYLICMADSYHDIGQNQQAIIIYKGIETSTEKGSEEWFFIQERLFQLYYEMHDPLCFDVAEQNLSMAERNFYANKTIYDNIECFAHSLVVFLKSLIVLDERDERIESAIIRAERFFSQIHSEFKGQKQIQISYSLLQEAKGDYYREVGKSKEAEQAYVARLDVCEYLYGTEPLDHVASRDFIKANEDLGYFYLSCEDYMKASDYFTDAIHFISRWDDSEEKKQRLDITYSALCHTMEKMGVREVKEEMADSKIRLDGHGYYFMSRKDYVKACDCFKDAIHCFCKWDDSEEKQLRLAEVYVALCYTMAHIDMENTKVLISEYKKTIEDFSLLGVKHYFINQLNALLSNNNVDEIKLSV